MSSIHGHEVMHWLGRRGPLARPALLAEASALFGAQARFHTCSRQDLTLEELLDFLLGKGKMGEGEEGVELLVQPCDH